jgi:hypothetical protein
MPSLSVAITSFWRGDERRGEDKDEGGFEMRGLWLIRTHTALRRDLHRPAGVCVSATSTQCNTHRDPLHLEKKGRRIYVTAVVIQSAMIVSFY